MNTYSLLPLLFVALGAVGCATPSAAPAALTAADDPALTDGRALTAAFFAGDTKTLWARFSPALRALNKNDEANLAAFRDTGVAQLGALEEKTSERVTHEGDVTNYVQVARFSKVGMPVEIAFGTVTSGTIVSFFVRPQKRAASLAPSTKLDYATRTTLRLPFDGAWDVAWGGRTIEQNQHAAVSDQRFAYDFVVIENDSQRFFRANRHQIVNLDFVEGMDVGPGGRLVATLRGGPEVEISRRQTRLFRARMTP